MHYMKQHEDVAVHCLHDSRVRSRARPPSALTTKSDNSSTRSRQNSEASREPVAVGAAGEFLIDARARIRRQVGSRAPCASTARRRPAETGCPQRFPRSMEHRSRPSRRRRSSGHGQALRPVILDTGFLISVDHGEDAARSFLATARPSTRPSPMVSDQIPWVCGRCGRDQGGTGEGGDVAAGTR